METEEKKKCSNKKHSDLNAINYCSECNLYLCNKCSNIHSEYLEAHHINNINDINHSSKKEINNEETFSGLCQEFNHKNELIFYCKDHNKLCCAACLCKIKENGNGLHHDCNVCTIKEIKNEKKNQLNENIKYFLESTKNIEESINKLKGIFDKMSESKEDVKMKISKIFTKLRNLINEREDKLLTEIDELYEKSFFKEDLIRKGEKISIQIKNLMDKKNLINEEWDNKILVERINDCINIENNIKNILEINENIKNCSSKEIDIKFKPENELSQELKTNIQQFGEILYSEIINLDLKFISGNNYKISKNGLLATKNSGGNSFNCLILGDKEIPKNKVSNWKIKINKNKNPELGIDILIGIGPAKFKGRMQDEVWCILANNQNNLDLRMKGKSLDYRHNKIEIKQNDIIKVVVDRIKGNLSFALNDINLGIVCSSIPRDEELYPIVILYEQGQNVEIVEM